MEFVILLATPVAGALLLASGGAAAGPPRSTSRSAWLTFLAACGADGARDRRGQPDRGARAVLPRPVQRLPGRADGVRGPHDVDVLAAVHARGDASTAASAQRRLRLYHSMYQLFMAMMLVALTTNNLGLLWVAMEAATLSTVLLVTLYRTPASLEAGWKYFILCGVGIAQALFGTILLYFAAEKVLGAEGVSALLWTHLDGGEGRARADACWASRSSSCWWATAPRWAWHRCTTGCRTRTPRARRRSRRCCRGCCSTSRSTRSCAARCWSRARCSRAAVATC